ncbi:uncharacterized protein LOC110464368 [Mizuhopecten yessoensis]|uniref:Uncharacterized protein n=1 Tax=Mizuhopecten yessoensis TaxID=6573 RepID=A0A210PU46_MIZYE|nr:uncharacterized protein LOC110464368 [Mizuhopecten yessoensis]OWF40030.1 hypothetical protein KP79_PYT19719 [Mizuhopecten yessoensis]
MAILERPVYSTLKSAFITSGDSSKICETKSAANQQYIKEDYSFNTESDSKDSFLMPNASKLPKIISISRTVVRTSSRRQQEIKTKEKCNNKNPKKPVHQSFPLKVYLPIKSMLVTALLLVQCSPSTAATPHINWQDIFLGHEDNICIFTGCITFRDTGQIEVISANNATGQTRDALVVSGQIIGSRETRIINGHPTNENVSNQDTDTENTDGLEVQRKGEIEEGNREDISSRGERSNHELVISDQRFSSHPSRLIDAQNLNENVNASTDDNVINGLGVLVISGQHHCDDRMASARCELVSTNVSDNNERFMEQVEIPSKDTSNRTSVLVITGQNVHASEREMIAITDHVTRDQTNTAVGLDSPTVYDNNESGMDNNQRVASTRNELVLIHVSDNNQQSDTIPSEDTSNTPGVLVITGQAFLINERESIAITDRVTWDQTYMNVGLYHPTDENNEAPNEQHGELAITDRTRQPILATAAHQLLVTEHTHVMDLQCPTNQRAAVTVSEIAVSGQHQLPNLIRPPVNSNSMTTVGINVNDPVAPHNNGTEISD